MSTPDKQIPPERQTIYYVGMALTGLGGLLFISTFFTAAANFGDFSNFEEKAQSQMFCAVSGMVLMIAGGLVMSIGANGWAGSGLVLDPKKARKDLEPWSHMRGGVIQDVLSEVEVVRKLEERLEPPEPQIKVRCRKCSALNDESAKFCNQCGSAV